MNVRKCHLVTRMLNAPTQMGPSLVPAMRGIGEMDGLAQVSTSMLNDSCDVCAISILIHLQL